MYRTISANIGYYCSSNLFRYLSSIIASSEVFRVFEGLTKCLVICMCRVRLWRHRRNDLINQLSPVYKDGFVGWIRHWTISLWVGASWSMWRRPMDRIILMINTPPWSFTACNSDLSVARLPWWRIGTYIVGLTTTRWRQFSDRNGVFQSYGKLLIQLTKSHLVFDIRNQKVFQIDEDWIFLL